MAYPVKKKLNEYSYVGTSNKAHSEGGYIFYRTDKYDLLKSGTFWLAANAPTKATNTEGIDADRICSWALLQVKGTDECFLFMDTHLTAASEENRTSFAEYHGLASATSDDITNYQANVIVNEIAAILTACGQNSSCPVILVGDMNAESSTKTYATLTANLSDAFLVAENNNVDSRLSSSPGYNYVADESSYIKNNHRIDYIFVNDSVEVTRYDMIHTSTNLCEYGAYLSDHNAIIAQIGIVIGE